ncbi:hypothetical protein SEUCBS140593_006005 [Sporothrix eucalyptigena]|uniref:Uncharacterized protein n=1 Tax=Sporothrix eucalyptigena TaxID=1812306 RepID=A0ABP0C1P0_9PEZI
MNYRHHSFSSRASSASLSDREDDAITPVEEDFDHREEPEPFQKTMPAPSHTFSSPTPLDDARLWRRMLALQRRFHCYNSARMSAALEDAEVEAVVPPRACLDLLNDSMSTAWLCEEVRAEVAALLTLVPDGIRSRAGSYGDIYEGGKAVDCASVTNAVTTTIQTATPTSTQTTTPTSTPTPTSRPSRRQERMQRRRGLRRRQE